MQGQLNICQKEKCFFIVYVNDKIPIFIEEIKRDVNFWEEKMLPILKQFYLELFRMKKGKNVSILCTFRAQ